MDNLKFDDDEFYFELGTQSEINQTKTKKMKNVQIETDEIEYEDVATNTKGPRNHVEISTEGLENFGKEKNIKYNENQLQNFLNKVVDNMIEQLNDNLTLFDIYEPFIESNNQEVNHLFTLQNTENLLIEKEKQLQITSISWNSTGLVLAAALGKFEHEGVCSDNSFIYLWNISRRDFKHDKPSFIIDTNTCIMTISFHPTLPSILAGGSFNGEILIWDTSRTSEPLKYSSRPDEYFHRECVTQALWFELKVLGASQQVFTLMTLSTDGKVLIWNPDHELKYPTKGYSILRKKDGSISQVGGLSIDQSCEDKNNFIVTSETGSVFKATMMNISFDKKYRQLFDQKDPKQLKWNDNCLPFMLNLLSKNIPDIKMQVEEYCKKKDLNEITQEQIFLLKPDIRKLYPNSVSFAYEQHFGPVYSVSHSPFDRNIFLTASFDGSARIYDSLSAKALINLDFGNSFIFKAQWSPTRPSVFALCSSNGEVSIFDLSITTKTPIKVIPNSKSCITLEYNKKQTDLIGVAQEGGTIKIYQLPQELIALNKNDQDIFTKIRDENNQ